MPIEDGPETIYMVTSNVDLVDGCCFNYGNGTAEAVNFSNGVIWGSGTGTGPWVMADLENGLFAGWENGKDRNISTNTPIERDFVTAIYRAMRTFLPGMIGNLTSGSATSRISCA